MSNERRFSDKQLDVLHDHYKETFTRIREVEALRDRLFLWVIGLFALLSLEIGFPTALAGSLGKLTILGQEINVQALPFPALLSATWMLTLVIVLRYCQLAIFVVRQYPYLHALEEAISPEVGGGDLYQREGKVYLQDYPVILDVAWIAYWMVFPVILIVVTFALAGWEILWLQQLLFSNILDGVLAAMLIFFLFAYRVLPGVTNYLRTRRARKAAKQLSAQTILTESSTITTHAEGTGKESGHIQQKEK